MKFRLAVDTDILAIMTLLNQAKTYLKEAGIDQWQKGYPDVHSFLQDIHANQGYVLTTHQQIIGYECISFSPEECYQHIQGNWKTDQPYAAIHRIMIDKNNQGKGLVSFLLREAETLCLKNNVHSIKIDTDQANCAMRHILTKNKFEYCGIINFDNSEKIAYEKMV